MMGNKYLIDTNIIIYYFNGIINDERVHSILRESFNISIITKIEFLSWRRLLDSEELQEKAVGFISNATIFDLDDAVADLAIISRQNHGMKTPDAIIGATAQLYGMELLTNNVRGFEKIDIKITTAEVSF